MNERKTVVRQDNVIGERVEVISKFQTYGERPCSFLRCEMSLNEKFPTTTVANVTKHVLREIGVDRWNGTGPVSIALGSIVSSYVFVSIG